jgi:hypothetical protein
MIEPLNKDEDSVLGILRYDNFLKTEALKASLLHNPHKLELKFLLFEILP